MAKSGTLNPARFQKDSLEQDLIDLQIPTQLLKFGRGGKPQFRIFSLTPDLEFLQWQSKKKADGQARVAIKDINDIKFGQVTEKFKRNNRADLQHLSFSLIYRDETANNDSLDLVCKDAKEYELWTKTLQALIEDKIDKALLEKIRSTNYDAAGASA